MKQQPLLFIGRDVTLDSVEVLLRNLALERTGFWSQLLGRRWPISHEPLRSDAAWLLPQVQQLRRVLKEKAQ